MSTQKQTGGLFELLVIVAFIGFLFFVVMVSGCVPPPPKGGVSNQGLHAQTMRQPDAPEGASSQELRERTTVHHPDGRIEIQERHAKTELGGSQDWAKIVKEYARAGKLWGIAAAVFLIIGAVVAFSTGWPIAGAILGAGALASIAVAWWAGLAAAAISLALWIGFRVAGGK